jgi:uncharacterized protein (TIGR03000 family)
MYSLVLVTALSAGAVPHGCGGVWLPPPCHPVPVLWVCPPAPCAEFLPTPAPTVVEPPPVVVPPMPRAVEIETKPPIERIETKPVDKKKVETPLPEKKSSGSPPVPERKVPEPPLPPKREPDTTPLDKREIIPPPKDADAPKTKKTSPDLSLSASLRVTAPDGVRVSVQGVELVRSTTSQVFRTPILEPGQLYAYEVRGEYRRNSAVASRTERVLIRSGQQSTVDFSDLAGPREHAHLNVVLPEGASLQVEGVPVRSGTHVSYETPVLARGLLYEYTLSATVPRVGGSEVVTRQVRLEAGGNVTVDFVGEAPRQTVKVGR